MKKLFYVLLAVLSAAACSKETDNPVPSAGGRRAVLDVSVETDGTKAYFLDDKSFRWQEGDQVGVYMYSTILDNVPGSYGVEGQYGPWIAPFDIMTGAGEASASFTRELDASLGEDYGNVAIYPYNAGSSYSYAEGGGILTFHLPDYYRDLPDFDRVLMPMAARLDMSEGGDKSHAEFKHVGGAVKVTFKNVPSGAKYFKLSADRNISGDFTVDVAGIGEGAVLSGEGSGKNVELQLAEGKAVESLDVYFPVPVGTYTFSVGVYGDGIVYLEKTATRQNAVGRGTILRMPPLTIPEPDLGPYEEDLDPSGKMSGLTYQVNVYSFADSDGDGVGDFNGIRNHLDYLDRLGVTALWLSPVHPAQSYHGYDVTDYESLNPLYGTETDFRNLISAAHARNIRIYMDYVINHTGDRHIWFLDAKEKGPESPYWGYYAFSMDPQSDVNAGLIDQIPAGWYNSWQWYPVTVGAGKQKRYAVELDWTDATAPTMTVTETTEDVTSGGSYTNAPRYLFWGDGTYTQFADNGTGKYRLVLDYASEWGCLVRTTSTDDWSEGTKWGFDRSGDQIIPGVPHVLHTGPSDDVMNIIMPDGDVYYYYSAFGTGMFVDLNYHYGSNCEESPAFKAVVASTEKWLSMGVDGFRLDAVKHIYADEGGQDNILFWQKFYSAVNNQYKSSASARNGLTGKADENIFMVGEVLSGESVCRPFYAGLPAIFEFDFWWGLKNTLNSESANGFVSGICDRYYRHQEVRSDAISTPKLSNHDEERTATSLGNYGPKKRLAATILLTSPGRPFIYQGEELGYWGSQENGDEYVRTPILWTTDPSSAASEGVHEKVDWEMLGPAISVESQAADKESLLTLYRRFAYARNTNPAMADGAPEYDQKTTDAVLSWYMHANDGSGKVCLVMHNITRYSQTVERWDGENLSTILAASDPVTVSGCSVTLPPYTSVVFALN